MNTNLKQIPLAEASDEQIREFAETMQIEVADGADRSKLLATLKLAWAKDTILVPDADEPAPEQTAATVVTPQQRLTGGRGSGDPVVTLTINNGTMPGGKDPVPVSVNGNAVVIQRNTRVDVPYRYFLALEAAKRGEVEQTDLAKAPEESDVTNYPLSVHNMPSADEIAAWHERTDNLLMPA